MSAALTIVISQTGQLRAIYHDDLACLETEGEARIIRASHVEPADCGWTADLSPVAGPTLGPYATRGAALSAEVAWLAANII